MLAGGGFVCALLHEIGRGANRDGIADFGTAFDRIGPSGTGVGFDGARFSGRMMSARLVVARGTDRLQVRCRWRPQAGVAPILPGAAAPDRDGLRPQGPDPPVAPRCDPAAGPLDLCGRFPYIFPQENRRTPHDR